MADITPTQTVRDIEDNRLTVDLAKAYAQAGNSMGDEDEIREGNAEPELPQGISREILDVLQHTLRQIDMVNVREITVDGLANRPEVAAVEAAPEHRRLAVEQIMDSLVDAVAEVLWMHQKGTDIDSDLQVAQAIGDEKTAEVDGEWTALFERIRRDFGL